MAGETGDRANVRVGPCRTGETGFQGRRMDGWGMSIAIVWRRGEVGLYDEMM